MDDITPWDDVTPWDPGRGHFRSQHVGGQARRPHVTWVPGVLRGGAGGARVLQLRAAQVRRGVPAPAQARGALPRRKGTGLGATGTASHVSSHLKS